MNEKWNPIKGYEGAYEISNTGLVRSLDRQHEDSRGRTYNLRGKVISPSTGKFGHKRVVLYEPGRKAETHQIHSLVLVHFVGPRPEGKICRHLNGDPSDNKVNNLVWGTPSENMYDKANHGTDYQRNKTHCPLGHALKEPNLQGGKLEVGWRTCKACHQAQSDRFNGSSLTYEELADMRYFMIHCGKKFKYNTRRDLEKKMYEDSEEWRKKRKDENIN